MNDRPCPTCDTHGPDLHDVWGDLTELHRALHHLGRTILDAAAPFTTWLERRLTQVTGGR